MLFREREGGRGTKGRRGQTDRQAEIAGKQTEIKTQRE